MAKAKVLTAEQRERRENVKFAAGHVGKHLLLVAFLAGMIWVGSRIRPQIEEYY